MNLEDVIIDFYTTGQGYVIRMTHKPTGRKVFAHYPIDMKSLYNELEEKIENEAGRSTG